MRKAYRTRRIPMSEIALADLPEARRYARALARFACGGRAGRGKLDPVYVDITQGRDYRANWTHYSSCGDLLHWLAWQFGVRSEWVNRDDTETGHKWTFGTEHNGGRDNISTLQGRKGFAGPAIVTPHDYLPEPGDFLLCWHDDQTGVHVRVAGNTDEHGVVETFDYGAGGMQAVEHPGASCNHLKLVHRTDGALLLDTTDGPHKSKRIQKIVRLTEIIRQSTAPTIAVPTEELEARCA